MGQWAPQHGCHRSVTPPGPHRMVQVPAPCGFNSWVAGHDAVAAVLQAAEVVGLQRRQRGGHMLQQTQCSVITTLTMAAPSAGQAAGALLAQQTSFLSTGQAFIQARQHHRLKA